MSILVTVALFWLCALSEGKLQGKNSPELSPDNSLTTDQTSVAEEESSFDAHAFAIEVYIAFMVAVVVISLNVIDVCGIFIGVFIFGIILLSVLIAIQKKKGWGSYGMPPQRRQREQEYRRLEAQSEANGIPLMNIYEDIRAQGPAEKPPQSYPDLDENLPPPPPPEPRDDAPPLPGPRDFVPPTAPPPPGPRDMAPPHEFAPPPPEPRDTRLLQLQDARHFSLPRSLAPPRSEPRNYAPSLPRDFRPPYSQSRDFRAPMPKPSVPSSPRPGAHEYTHLLAEPHTYTPLLRRAHDFAPPAPDPPAYPTSRTPTPPPPPPPPPPPLPPQFIEQADGYLEPI